MRKVWIVLLNYKGHEDTAECLETLLKLDYPSFQILVVDNSPTEESIAYLQQWARGEVAISTAFPDLVYPLQNKPMDLEVIHENELCSNTLTAKLTIVKANHNNGFAAGNNLALKYISGAKDYAFVWLLNNDTVVPADSLKQLVLHFESVLSSKDVKLGMLGSTLLHYNAPTIVQGVGGRFNKYLAITAHLGQGISVDSLDKQHFAIDYVIGASMFISKEFLEEVGLMPEDYFLYFEEIDWATNAKKYSYTIGYCPTSFVYHKEGAAINNAVSYANKKSELADYYGIRNRILFTGKNYPLYLPFTYLSFLLIIANRIKRKEYYKLGMILKIMLNPFRPYQKRLPIKLV